MEGRLEAAVAQEGQLREELEGERGRREEVEETLRTEREKNAQQVRRDDRARTRERTQWMEGVSTLVGGDCKCTRGVPLGALVRLL